MKLLIFVRECLSNVAILQFPLYEYSSDRFLILNELPNVNINVKQTFMELLIFAISVIFKASLNLSSDTVRIISLAAEHLKINLRKS